MEEIDKWQNQKLHINDGNVSGLNNSVMQAAVCNT